MRRKQILYLQMIDSLSINSTLFISLFHRVTKWEEWYTIIITMKLGLFSSKYQLLLYPNWFFTPHHRYTIMIIHYRCVMLSIITFGIYTIIDKLNVESIYVRFLSLPNTVRVNASIPIKLKIFKKKNRVKIIEFSLILLIITWKICN